MTPREVLSEGEERFERARRFIGLFLAPLVFLVIYFTPIESVSIEAHRLFAIIGFVLVFWLCETVPLPITALLGAVFSVVLGVAPAKEVLAPFANPLVFLFIGSFILAEAIIYHGLDRRFAFAMISIKFLQASPMRILFALGIVSAVASMWISNTAATAMMLPIGLGILNAMRDIDSESAEKKYSERQVFERLDAHDSLWRLCRRYSHACRHPAEPHRYRHDRYAYRR
ncbi:MAG: SLC13 family permease [Thermodesulfobacteriota bacterium]